MRQIITITNSDASLTRIATDEHEGARQLTVQRDGEAVFGIDITEDATMVVGFWDDDDEDGTWIPLATFAPGEGATTDLGRRALAEHIKETIS